MEVREFNGLDLTFIINEPGKTLKDRFNVLIKDARFFDCLVGYFYVSGFHSVYKALENTDTVVIEGNLFKQVDEVMNAIKKHLNVRFEIKGVVRKDVWDYPFRGFKRSSH